MSMIQAGRIFSAVLALGLGTLAADWASAQQKPDDKKAEGEIAKTPVDTLLKNVSAASTRPKALQELVQRLTAAEADTDILMRTDDFVKALVPMMKNAFDKNLSTLATDALAVFGKSDPEVVDLFVTEMQKGASSSRLLAVRGVGKIGAPAKEKAEPVLMGILKDPKTKTSNAALYNEALMARAFLGGPFETEIVPEMLRIATLMKDVEAQTDMLIAIAQNKELLETYAKQLEPLIIKAYQTISVQMFKGAKTQELVKILVSLKTPNTEKIIYDIMAGTDKGIQPWGFRPSIAKLIKEAYDVPSEQIVNALLVGIEKEGSPGNLRDIGNILASYGERAKPTLPALQKYLALVPQKGSDGGEKSRPVVARYVQDVIEKIEKAVAEKKGGGAKAD
jgi:hypothetical protein